MGDNAGQETGNTVAFLALKKLKQEDQEFGSSLDYTDSQIQQFKVSDFTLIPSKSAMSPAADTIHPRAQFFPTPTRDYEVKRQVNCSQMQWQGRAGQA